MSEFYSCTRRDPGIQNPIIMNLDNVTFVECVSRDIYKVHFVSGEEITINAAAAERLAKRVGLTSFK